MADLTDHQLWQCATAEWVSGGGCARATEGRRAGKADSDIASTVHTTEPAMDSSTVALRAMCSCKAVQPSVNIYCGLDGLGASDLSAVFILLAVTSDAASDESDDDSVVSGRAIFLTIKCTLATAFATSFTETNVHDHASESVSSKHQLGSSPGPIVLLGIALKYSHVFFVHH